jgi:hypothetical protein
MKFSNDFNKLEKFFTFLKENKNEKKEIQFNQDITGIKGYYDKYVNELKKIDYFHFIPKDNSKLSEANTRLAFELKTLLKYYQFQSYIVAINSLYFLLIFSKRTNAFSMKSLMFTVIAAALGMGFYRFHYNKISIY